MAIKKIKIASVWINPEKEITSKQPATLGKKYKVCEVNVKVADDCPNYGGKYMKKTFWGYTDKEDVKKNKTPTEQAEYFKAQNEDKEVLLDVEEKDSVGTDGKTYQNLSFKTLTKAQKDVAAQFIK